MSATHSRPTRKIPDFSVHQDAPFNGEPPLHVVGSSFVTPTSRFFVRNHAPVPEVDADGFTVRMEGMVGEAREWTVDELRTRFETVEVTATLQCAGNRRQELMAVREIPGEVGWACGAIGTAVWRGVRLRDVLDDAGLNQEAEHVELIGADRVEKDGRTIGFGGSIPVRKALDPSVLLAFEMNGQPLPPEHGFPVRAVVPGYIGARSVKWLERIVVRPTPSDNYYQARSYRLFPPDVTAETADWEDAPSLDEMALNAVITECTSGDSAGESSSIVRVRGYAVAGGDRRIERVEVSADDGREWVEARLEGPGGEEVPDGESAPGVWCLWSAEVPVDRVPVEEVSAAGSPGREIELVARTVDSQGNGQPPKVEPLWNFKGYMNNAWHRVRVALD